MNDTTYHDDQTLAKAHTALRRVTGDPRVAEAAINEMQNAGILFRERARGPEAPQDIAKRLVRSYAIDHLDKSDPAPDFDVYVVWFAKTLRNWKALVSTSLHDGMYYEVTFNGDAGEAYLDAYKKFENVAVKL